ncbi:hypothetical protein [Burkholderia cenocepacia]|uniref:hypothetical protein n=1 Tax=Burkholderia cenocepacia TaxID=95486 RepID=UPI000A6F8DF6|nr:hypothetical protein [Burkholderia cenocepacia]
MSSVTATLRRRSAACLRAARNPLPVIRYINRLIRNAPSQFDAVEIHGVRQFPDTSDPARRYCEMDDDHPSFFSVYLHFVTGGVTCCADLPTHLVALHCAGAVARRHGWPVYDCCPPSAVR